MTTNTSEQIEQILEYSVDAYGYTPQKVADEFAASFPEPRKARKVNASGEFKLVDGTNTYRIVLVAGVRLISVERYEIYRIESVMK